MIECSPDSHFTQTQNTNQESLVKSNSHNFLKALCGVIIFFFLRSFLGLQLKLQFFWFLVAWGGGEKIKERGKKKSFFIKLKQMAFLLVKNT